jgi:hypothetical protein
LYVGHLVLQAGCSPLLVGFHKLVLSAKGIRVRPSQGQSHDLRYHLLEALESGFHVSSGCYIVLDPINEWRIRDAPRVGRRSGFSGKKQWLANDDTEDKALKLFKTVTYFGVESAICVYATASGVVL